MAKLVQTTYGDALFDLAVEESRVDALFDEAEAVIKAFDDNDELGKFLNHPKIKKEEKIYNKLLEEKGFTYAITRIAEPGKSEHQTGLAIDFCIYKDEKCYIEHEIEELLETKWVHQNCYRYGFILRYPEGKEDITKYSYEPWHIRYVGNIASYIYNNNLTLEEYKERESKK